MIRTPDQHRKEAEALLVKVEGYGFAHPARADLLRQATVHALLALGNVPVVNVLEIQAREEIDHAATVAAAVKAEAAAKPIPAKKTTTPARKRAATKKTTAPKETPK